MRKLTQRLMVRFDLWLYNRCEVAQFDGIVLADLCGYPDGTPHFRDTLLAALRLLKEVDSRRFARVRKRLCWIVSKTLAHSGTAQYYHPTRTCAIDFPDCWPEYDLEFLAAWYACTLVHEVTHGEIQDRGIAYQGELRRRIEHLCVAEEQRFVRRLAIARPEMAARLNREFNASHWQWSWTATRFERFRKQLTRFLDRTRR